MLEYLINLCLSSWGSWIFFCKLESRRRQRSVRLNNRSRKPWLGGNTPASAQAMLPETVIDAPKNHSSCWVRDTCAFQLSFLCHSRPCWEQVVLHQELKKIHVSFLSLLQLKHMSIRLDPTQGFCHTSLQPEHNWYWIFFLSLSRHSRSCDVSWLGHRQFVLVRTFKERNYYAFSTGHDTCDLSITIIYFVDKSFHYAQKLLPGFLDPSLKSKGVIISIWIWPIALANWVPLELHWWKDWTSRIGSEGNPWGVPIRRGVHWEEIRSDLELCTIY